MPLTIESGAILAAYSSRNAVRFCFISRELEEFMVTWNHHRIRWSTMAETPGILYHMPEESGINCSCHELC